MLSTQKSLEYNSSREKLIISEYGRHVQKLIIHAKKIENKEERQAFVESIINLMHQMNPQNKNVSEYRLKLWRHLFRIADYDIDVTPPEGVSSTKPEVENKRVILGYPQSEFRYRHYGNTIQLMIDKALKMEDEELKTSFTYVIAAYMKLAYRTWNREHYVNDEVIKADLVKLSKGGLRLEESYNIVNLSTPTKIMKGKSNGPKNSKNGKGGMKKNKNHRNNMKNNNRNKKRK